MSTLTHPTYVADTGNMDGLMKQCLDNCLECHRQCLQSALQHCLAMGGPHTEPGHFRLMMDCAALCHTSAHFLMSGSPRHMLTCDICATVCRECEASCRSLGGMEECAEACARCAHTCEQMTASH